MVAFRYASVRVLDSRVSRQGSEKKIRRWTCRQADLKLEGQTRNRFNNRVAVGGGH